MIQLIASLIQSDFFISNFPRTGFRTFFLFVFFSSFHMLYTRTRERIYRFVGFVSLFMKVVALVKDVVDDYLYSIIGVNFSTRNRGVMSFNLPSSDIELDL